MKAKYYLFQDKSGMVKLEDGKVYLWPFHLRDSSVWNLGYDGWEYLSAYDWEFHEHQKIVEGATELTPEEVFEYML